MNLVFSFTFYDKIKYERWEVNKSIKEGKYNLIVTTRFGMEALEIISPEPILVKVEPEKVKEEVIKIITERLKELIK